MVEAPTKMKHDTPEKRKIAEDNCILLVQVGSGLHGIAIKGRDDRDEMGLCIEPPEYLVGVTVDEPQSPIPAPRTFQQWEFRTQQMHVRSGPGDLDHTNYSLRKWAKLAAAGNPTVILPLFAPDDEVMWMRPPGEELRAMKSMFLSRSAGERYIGYLDTQRDRMLGLLSQRTNRPELVEQYGFDVKFASHALRLGIQGVELLTTGELTLPMQTRNYLIGIREGVIPQREVLYQIAWFRKQLVDLCDTSPLPLYADYQAINRWLTKTYLEWWAAHEDGWRARSEYRWSNNHG